MSTPIFDRLFAESDDTTRAHVEKALLTAEFTNYLDSINVTPHTTSAEAQRAGLLGGIGDNA